MPMKVGYFADVNAPGRYDEFARVLDETRELALACEELGYDSIWFGEHHFGHEGFESIPNPILMSADIAARRPAGMVRANSRA
jgi:alkanesulfonate monooxygenase SsuD/methylene tetrahydromethanopterin reductase-like flavin-dependent oxidoreductase (luciferase family)